MPYTGLASTSKGTSISADVSAFVQTVLRNHIPPGAKVLDYGAGEFARVADLLRKQGHRVYAFDPHNGVGTDGWGMGRVSTSRPRGEKFDVAFTSFVLNVVKVDVEAGILAKIRRFAPVTFHITRGRELAAQAKRALARGDRKLTSFFRAHYDPVAVARFDRKGVAGLTGDDLLGFAAHGFPTRCGFQRLPMLENQGYRLANKGTSKYKVYIP